MRARMLRLHPKTVNLLMRLKTEAEQDGEYRVARRIHATLLNHDGRTSGEIAALLKAPRSRVSQWLANYLNQGYEGLLEGSRSGRPASLSKAQRRKLADIVDSGPVAYGFLSGAWSAVMIARLIEETFGVTYDARHARRLLDQLDFSLQRPKRQLAKADPVRQHRWRRYAYPNIKKKPKTPARR